MTWERMRLNQHGIENHHDFIILKDFPFMPCILAEGMLKCYIRSSASCRCWHSLQLLAMCIENGRWWQCQKLCKASKAHLPLGSLIAPLDMYVKYIMYIYIYTHLAGVQNRKLHLHGNVSMNLSSTLFGTTKSWYWNGGGFLVEMIGIWESVLKMACTLHLSFSKDLDVTPVPEAPFHAERILHWPSPHQRRVVVLPWEVLCHRILSHCLTCTSEWKNESFWESLSKWCFQQFSKVITYLLGCPPSQ